jgi:uncharacterized protein (TIGR03083 family)
MTTTATPVAQLSRIERGEEAWRLASATYDALLDLLEELDPEEWATPTVCAPWTVADMVGHLIGAAESEASIVEGIRQQVVAARRKGDHDGSPLDAWTALHVDRHASLTPAQRLTRLREVAPAAVRGRSKLPRLIGRIPVSLVGDAEGSLPDGSPEKVTLGELNTVIYTRDTWLHRIDIARATGRDPRLDPSVDRRIVADVVVEWAGRHGQPFSLILTGPAGGRYQQGTGGPRIDLDAVELCWILSGRGEPDPGHPAAALLRTRVLF